ILRTPISNFKSMQVKFYPNYIEFQQVIKIFDFGTWTLVIGIVYISCRFRYNIMFHLFFTQRLLPESLHPALCFGGHTVTAEAFVLRFSGRSLAGVLALIVNSEMLVKTTDLISE
ncbi:MAG: hypothetical protein FWD31_05485, partial [Planctomycetaceae bacterium]|nr:hypothetical protein [Planctomycetaceae bacterium]